FKVIIISSSPVRLIITYTLSRASINFIILKSQLSIILNASSNLVINPIGLRILSQLKLLPTFNTPYSIYINELNSYSYFLKAVSRYNFTTILYNLLLGKTPIALYITKYVYLLSKATYAPETLTRLTGVTSLFNCLLYIRYSITNKKVFISRWGYLPILYKLTICNTYNIYVGNSRGIRIINLKEGVI
ncbi:hypothetical protein N5P37_011754, partial [Trichoderma harzianum]